jgi:hypothetical protein
MTVKFHARFEVPIKIEVTNPVTVYVDQITFDPKEPNEIRIIVLEEPLRDLNLLDYVNNYPRLYDYVLTFQQDILANNPKARYFRGADIWSRGYDSGEKRFAVSTVVGGKNDLRMSGYKVRHETWIRQNEITKVPREFYLSDSYKWSEVDYKDPKNTILYGSKDKMFDCMFHIAIENCSIPNYYSEKLLDCIETLTVPIYYGCTNIGEYFNTDSIIRADGSRNIIDACNQLSPELYQSMLPILIENKARIAGRKNYMGQLEDAIKELLNIK